MQRFKDSILGFVLHSVTICVLVCIKAMLCFCVCVHVHSLSHQLCNVSPFDLTATESEYNSSINLPLPLVLFAAHHSLSLSFEVQLWLIPCYGLRNIFLKTSDISQIEVEFVASMMDRVRDVLGQQDNNILTANFRIKHSFLNGSQWRKRVSVSRWLCMASASRGKKAMLTSQIMPSWYSLKLWPTPLIITDFRWHFPVIHQLCLTML